jgi:hypothetical protein
MVAYFISVISMNFLNLSIDFKTCKCLFFRQNGGEGFIKGKENPIPQVFNSSCGLREEVMDTACKN